MRRSAAKATATAGLAAPVATAKAAATTTPAVSAVAAGQAVDAGAGGVGLTAGAHGFAVGQIQSGKLRGLQRVDVAWQFVAVFAAALLCTTCAAPVGAAPFWARAVAGTTALAIAPVVKTTAFALAIQPGFTGRALAA